jgi:hypothetical protein
VQEIHRKFSKKGGNQRRKMSKEQYTRPTLKKHGLVRELTQTGSGGKSPHHKDKDKKKKRWKWWKRWW